MNRKVVVGLILFLTLAWLLWPRKELNIKFVNISVPKKEQREISKETKANTIQTQSRSPSAVAVEASEENIPEFAKKIRTEIKTSLSAIYTAEKATHADLGHYSTNFRVLGFLPVGEPNNLNYRLGFIESYTEEDEPADEAILESTDDIVFDDEDNEFKSAENKLRYSDYAKKIDLEAIKSFCKQGCTTNHDKFEIISATNLDKDPTLDIWLINQDKEFIHASDDLKD